MSISKEQLDHSLCGKSYVELKDLVQLIEDNFGYSVTLQRKKERHILTEEQKARITSFIFKDESVLSQLHQAMNDRGHGISTYSDSEDEFAQLLKHQND